MENNIVSWKRMMFKNNKVWQAMGPDDKPMYKNGKVLIKYNINQEYEYWVYENSLESIDRINQTGTEVVNKQVSPENKKKQNPGRFVSSDENIPEDAVCIYTDGASSGNPGPSGIGILFRFGKHEKEVSRYIGIATNNMAELEAIKTALLELKTTKNPVRIFTDSSYSFGVLALNWKAKKNEDLIDSIKKSMTKFKDLKIIKVRGHTGHEGNERADFLASKAVKSAPSE
jgi:ribonuclease HI